MKYLICLFILILTSCTNTEDLKNIPIAQKKINGETPQQFNAEFNTTKGKFILSCHKDWGEKGVKRLYELIQKKFYNNVKFFRYVPGFVVQFGISGDPKTSSIWKDANIKDDPVKKSNTKGTLSFATAGKNTRTTQLFINLGDNSRLDSMGFTPICKVTSGMEVVLSLYSGYGEAPTSKQTQIQNMGNAYLDKAFPNLDYIKQVNIL